MYHLARPLPRKLASVHCTSFCASLPTTWPRKEVASGRKFAREDAILWAMEFKVRVKAWTNGPFQGNNTIFQNRHALLYDQYTLFLGPPCIFFFFSGPPHLFQNHQTPLQSRHTFFQYTSTPQKTSQPSLLLLCSYFVSHSHGQQRNEWSLESQQRSL